MKAAMMAIMQGAACKRAGWLVSASVSLALVAALGACTAMTLKLYIERKKLPIMDVEVLLTFDRIYIEDCESCSQSGHEKDEKVQHISRLIYVTGEVTEEQKQRLLYIAGRCPVHITLHSNPHVEDALIVRKA